MNTLLHNEVIIIEVFTSAQDAYQNNGVSYDDSPKLAIMLSDFENKLKRLDILVLAILGERDI